MPRSRRNRRPLAACMSLAGLALLLSACASRAPQDYLNHPEGPFARKADGLWDLTFAIAVVIFFLVEGALVYALIRFRRRPGREAQQFHGNTKAEVVLTLVPALILFGIAIPTVSTVFDVTNEPKGGGLQITVVGHQFWWEYRYEESGVVTANELYIPVDTPVRLRLEGANDDVIHSFWVPRLAGKQDVVPGHVNHLNIQADREGVFLGQCTEFCGLSHANMRLRVIAQSASEFERWLDDQASEPEDAGTTAEQQGQKVFEATCTACHSLDPTPPEGPSIAPNLAHFGSRATFAGAMFENTEENLRAWLDDPAAMKPGSRMPDYNLTSEQIDQLIAYLQGLE